MTSFSVFLRCVPGMLSPATQELHIQAFPMGWKAIPLECNHEASVFQSLWEENCQLGDTDTAFAVIKPVSFFTSQLCLWQKRGTNWPKRIFSKSSDDRCFCCHRVCVHGELEKTEGVTFSSSHHRTIQPTSICSLAFISAILRYIRSYPRPISYSET